MAAVSGSVLLNDGVPAFLVLLVLLLAISLVFEAGSPPSRVSRETATAPSPAPGRRADQPTRRCSVMAGTDLPRVGRAMAMASR